MNNKVLFGLSNVHIAFLDPLTGEYKTPQNIPGAVKLALNAEGEDSVFYADNIAYFKMTSNNGYSGDLEIALVPDEILMEMLGWEKDSNGMVVEVADGQQKEFALLFEVEGNKKNKRYIYYNCKASRPNEEHNTKNDKPDPDKQSLSIVAMPTIINGKKIVKGTLELSESNKSVYDGFFKTVLEPKAEE